MTRFRTEKDSLGSLNVPANAPYGIHTLRSLQNFPISRLRWHPLVIVAILHLKLACAQANRELRLLDGKKAKAIENACRKIIKMLGAELIPHLTSLFPLDVFQAGSGTSTNMNVNEVIARLAKVHPNDDVNRGQSTNNVIPSAIRIASIEFVSTLEKRLLLLQKALQKKAKEFGKILKSGRTHLQDAVPMTLGQEFGAYATAVGKHTARLKQCTETLRQLGIGGNAVGTGINTPKKFRSLIIKNLTAEMKQKFVVTPDGIESTQFLTDIAALSSVLKLIAIDLNKICNDLRLLSSGPQTGLGEISLPAVEPGSSIMPGKVNPSICEAVNMVCHQVIGNDTTITLSCTAGNLDLNTHMPIIGHNIIESLEILGNAIAVLEEKCISGITANKERCTWYVENSMALATALNPYIGYDKAAALVKESLKTGKTLKELVLGKKLMSEKQLKKVLDPRKLTKPNLTK